MSALNKDFMSALRPLDIGPKIRLGRLHDGGYVVPKSALSELSLLISFGYGHDSTFEQDFLRLSKTHVVDLYESSINLLTLVRKFGVSSLNFWKPHHFPRYDLKNLIKYILLRTKKRIRYYNYKVTDFKTSRKDFPIREIVSSIPNCSRTAMKIDIEGGEYDILPLIDFKTSDFLILLIEFHDIQSRKNEFLSLLNYLTQSFGIVNTHINNFGSVINGVPNVVELTFMNRKCLPNHLKLARSIPSDLDSPNSPRRDEITFVYS
ncbi:MAG: hypothetical protein EB029_03670 [Actinobacteria bacterium]|jgi:hypothetical protein|nr:hypothetical protein [Actinomycetota bacterium]